MKLNVLLTKVALPIAFVLVFPAIATAQNFEENTALQGTRLTYYQRPAASQCQADCANNPNCKGLSWIQAGTYKAGDPAMCYLLSTVTGKGAARGYFSWIKGGGASTGAREANTSLTGTRLTYFQRPTVDQCQADCLRWL